MIEPATNPDVNEQQISAKKQQRIEELIAQGMTLAEAKAVLEDDDLKGISGGFYPMG